MTRRLQIFRAWLTFRLLNLALLVVWPHRADAVYVRRPGGVIEIHGGG